MDSWPRTEQEERLDAIFDNLNKLFKKLGKTTNGEKVHNLQKDITNKLKEAKSLIKDFEREARTDGMPAVELADRKRNLVTELNHYIQMKKDFANEQSGRNELMTGAQAQEEADIAGMSQQQLMVEGRRQIRETNKTLINNLKIVKDTEQIGAATASTLYDQSKQIEKIVDDLNEIEFNMKKATKVIRDITRGLLTDKCIFFLLALVVLGVIAIIVLKIVKPHKNDIAAIPGNVTDLYNSVSDNVKQFFVSPPPSVMLVPPPSASRKLLDGLS